MRYSPGQGDTPRERVQDRHVPEGGHPHGKPASWVVVATVVAAFAIGGLSMIMHTWWLFWVCAAIVLLCIPAGKASGMMNDTISWGSTPATEAPARDRGAAPGREQPAAGQAAGEAAKEVPADDRRRS